MPVGINVEDDPKNDGFVLIEFVDPALKGPALAALNAAGGPYIAEKLSREKGAERVRYRVPEGNAAAAGLIAGSGTAVDDIVQFGATDPTGIVLPTVPITHDNIHAPVIRRGTYRGGDNGNVDTQPSEPVNPAIAAPTQAEVADYVHGEERSLKEREGRDPDNDGILGFAGIQPLMTPIAPDSADKPAPAVSPDVSPFGAQAGAQPPETPAPELTQTSLVESTPSEIADRGYPDGEPNDEWTRAQINEYARKVKNLDVSDARTKADALALLNPPTE